MKVIEIPYNPWRFLILVYALTFLVLSLVYAGQGYSPVEILSIVLLLLVIGALLVVLSYGRDISYLFKNPCKEVVVSAPVKRGAVKIECVRRDDECCASKWLKLSFEEKYPQELLIKMSKKPSSGFMSGLVAVLPAELRGKCLNIEIEPFDVESIEFEDGQQEVTVSAGESSATLSTEGSTLRLYATLDGDYRAVKLLIEGVEVFRTEVSGIYPLDVFGRVREKVIVRVPYLPRFAYACKRLREIFDALGTDKPIVAKNVTLKAKLVLEKPLWPDAVKEFKIRIS